MNTGLQFKHYVWLVNILRKRHRMTLKELQEQWVLDEVAEGNPLPRSSFHKYRDAIRDMFGLDIECDGCYRYYISNPGEVDNDLAKQWMLSTLTTGLTLTNSAAIKDDIILENVPAGYEFLPVIMQAIRQRRTIAIGYRKFGFEAYTKPVDPYAVRLFRQRWYLLTDNGERMAVYSLDRMLSATLTDQRFRRAASFSSEEYFSEYFGVMVDGTPMEHVVLRAYGKMADLLRTLPLHRSQRELGSADGHTDFAIDIRPSIDFVSELMSKVDGLDVLEPASLKAKMRHIMEEALKRSMQG
ncbi:MAG: WYL domain-containing protein [Prevotella sp.]|jgi:hypothetical protein|nr:WYL domain-containing protein [Prevotella sp.]